MRGLTISKASANLPRFLRPGLVRESLQLSVAVKNRYACVRGLYFRDKAPLEVTFRNGVRWGSTQRDSLLFLLEEIVAGQCYTPRWFYRPRPGDLVVDLGGNIGVFAAHVCNLSPGVRVACFEPDPVSYGTLARNIASNNLEGRVQAHHLAVWRKEDTLYLASTQSGKSVGQQALADADGAAASVKSISLAQALEIADPTGGRIALLKIDTEGAETDILEAADAATMQRVNRVALEYHSDEKRLRCCELLKNYGFRVRWASGDADTGIYLAYRSL